MACKRAHNFAEGEPITFALTVPPDLGKRRSAQRFRWFHGKDGVAGSIPAGGSTTNQQARPGPTPGLPCVQAP